MNLEPLLWDFLPRQRWYAGKGREVSAYRVEELVELHAGEPALYEVIVRVAYGDASDRYQLPVGVRFEGFPDQLAGGLEPVTLGEVDVDGRTGLAYDALHDPELTPLWLHLLAGGGEVGPLRFTSVVGDIDLPAHLIGTEQSNSSLVFGDDFILKLYRRLTDGLNPDLEVTRALAAVGCEVVAEPLGWIEGVGATLGMLQRYFRSGTEGWPLAITSVRDLYAERDLHADEVGGDFAFDAHRLGVTTALLHRDLAKALPSRVAEPGAAIGVAKQMHSRLDAALDIVGALGEFAARLRAVYDEVAKVDERVPIQRIHGDYHLGQVLRVESGWVVLDFEGEPIRSLEERTALMSPLRDVAGMLRSFDYAARHLLAERPDDRSLVYRADEWAERNSAAFCDGYAEITGSDPRDSRVLLRAFLLDKAVYEVVYEARHRPSWLPIPMGAIDRLTATA